ncbi:MAG: hypothetical protein K2M91_10900 [Lachnospiraceae bacterium]|nr:hypothetical protein [Lachnospiraceae bacterium]
MLLKNRYKNEYNEIEGTAFFPFFNKDITVKCRKGVSLEYAEKCLHYLEKVDEKLILQICKYAEFYLKDTLENTSIGELYYDEKEPFPHDDLLDLLQYFQFEILYIEEPPAPFADSFEVLNLYGGCDWQEYEGIQCLVKNGEVIFLGGYNSWSVWNDYSKDYIGNYVLYERRDELRKMAAEKTEQENYWRYRRFARWRSKGLSAVHKLENFSDVVLASKENVDPKEATKILEDTYLFQMMNEYPKLLEESIDFWYECYCIEKEKDIGELVMYISENCQWNLF